MAAKHPVRNDFDRAFFDRYYQRKNTAVVTLRETNRLATFVVSYLQHLGVPVQSVLDAGCGVGLWQKALYGIDPRIRYTGLDVSQYACERYGWVNGTIAEFKSRAKFDLVVCQDVLQYVGDVEARRSLANIGRLCRGALYLDVPTREDLTGGALDVRRTDRAIHVRPAAWYKRIVRRQFVSAGGGVFIPRRSRTVLLALERA